VRPAWQTCRRGISSRRVHKRWAAARRVGSSENPIPVKRLVFDEGSAEHACSPQGCAWRDRYAGAAVLEVADLLNRVGGLIDGMPVVGFFGSIILRRTHSRRYIWQSRCLRLARFADAADLFGVKHARTGLAPRAGAGQAFAAVPTITVAVNRSGVLTGCVPDSVCKSWSDANTSPLIRTLRTSNLDGPVVCRHITSLASCCAPRDTRAGNLFPQADSGGRWAALEHAVAAPVYVLRPQVCNVTSHANRHRKRKEPKHEIAEDIVYAHGRAYRDWRSVQTGVVEVLPRQRGVDRVSPRATGRKGRYASFN